MRKVFNFGAGPAMLPEEVLLLAQSEMLDWHDTGISIMEHGHRGKEFQEVAEKTEADLRELMDIPKHYRVLFIAGGATTQFAMVPLNLLGKKKTADYIETGVWSKKAIDEAMHYGQINIAAKVSSRNGLAHIPPQEAWLLNDQAAYVHYTPNETIAGVEFQWVPKTGEVPLVADMTSMILSRPVNVCDYGVIYAGTQKNVGQAGLTLVIVRDDLIQEALPGTPTLYRYQTMADSHSFYNTPPTYNWYMTGLVLEWMKRHGGVNAFYAINLRKAKKLYDVIDQRADFYHNPVDPSCRSMMNVAFYLKDNQLTGLFLQEASQIGLQHLAGHRVSGGVRASIYNAMPESAVELLANFMIDFAKRNG